MKEGKKYKNPMRKKIIREPLPAGWWFFWRLMCVQNHSNTQIYILYFKWKNQGCSELKNKEKKKKKKGKFGLKNGMN